MLGPGDRTNRFLHWPIRLEKGGNVLVPGKPDDMVQYIDIRDVAQWFITLAEEKTSGVFNAVGPKEKQTLSEFVDEASKTFDSTSLFTFIDNYSFLTDNNIYFQIPWVIANKEHFGSARIDNSKAIKAGLVFRPLKQTIEGTLDWFNSENFDKQRKQEYLEDDNILLNREKKLFQEWTSFNKG